MRKFFVLTFLLFIFAFPGEALASSAKAVVESEVQAGEAQIYQSVETTVNGQTVKKESTQPGKLELEMEQTGNNAPTVSFTQEPASIPTTAPTITPVPDKNGLSPASFVAPIIEFVRKLLANLTFWFR